MTPFEHDGFGAFTVVYGPNEQGKTLLIDALFKLLFKKELKRTKEKRFGNMKRVGEQPEGYVVLQTHADEVKLEGEDTISTFFPGGVTPDDFRNVFLVRDSDLGILDEREYYAGITERLTGLRSSEIEALLKVVQAKGRLRTIATDSALSNSIEHGKVAERVKRVERLVEDIKKTRDDLAFARFDELTDDLVDTRRRRRALEDERDRVRAAQKRRQFERARDSLSELEGLEATLASMGALDEGKLKHWQRIAMEREHLEKDLARDEKGLERLAENRGRAESDLEAHKSKTAAADRHFRTVERELSQRVDEYQNDRLEFRRRETMSGLTRKSFVASAAVLVLALVAYMITPSSVIGVIGAVALVAALGLGWSLQKHRRARGDLDRRSEHLRENAARLGVKVDTVLDLQSAVGDLEREVDRLRDEERERQESVERLRADAHTVEERLAETRTRIAEIDAEVVSLRADTRVDTPEEYQAAIDRRKSVEHSCAARREVLQGLVPISSTGPGAIAEWRAAIEAALADDETEAEATDDPERGARLDREIQELEARESDTARRLDKGGKQLYNLQMKAVDLKVLDEAPRCRTLHDLDHLAARLDEYRRRVEHEQAIAQRVIGVFLDIDAEERARVGELFGPSAQVSTLFREITDGRYRAVTYDTEQDQVLVEPAAGKPIRASALSGGAVDQLYLAIRFCIAERLLPTSKGFFILDDPFIKADAHRLDNLLNTLRRFVRGGWQILYFSAKKEVLDALAPDIEAGDVRIVELDRNLFSQPVWNEDRGAHSRTT